jgi:hypothetical protein
MNNTMRTIIFIVSLFAFLFFFIAINAVFPSQSVLNPGNIAVLVPVLYIAGYIVALYTQALIKYLYTKKRMAGTNTVIEVPAKSFELRDRLVILTLPILAVLLPIVQRRQVNAESLRNLVFLVILAIVIEVLFFINSKTLKAYVTDKGFAVNGIDFRLELSIPFSYTNAVGWYPFERIDNYLAFENKVLLYSTYDLGAITLECNEEQLKQIKGLLIAKKIPVRKY